MNLNAYLHIGILTVIGTLSGSLVQAADVAALANQADAVVAATTSTRVESNSSVQFDLSIHRVFKGSLSAGQTIIVNWNRPPVGWGGVKTPGASPGGLGQVNAEYMGLWFLQDTNVGWVPLRARGGPPFFTALFYPATKDGPPQGSRPVSGTLGDVLLSEIASAIQAPASAYLPRPLMGAVEELDTPFIRGALLGIVTSGAKDIDRADALAVLLAKNDVRAIQIVSDEPSLASYSSGAGGIVSAVRDSFRPTDHISLVNLIRLATAPHAANGLSAAAVRALSAIHTRETIPFLASLLGNPDLELRARAMFGLSGFVNGCPMQTPDNVRSMEYIRTELPSAYRTADTLSHLVIRTGSMDQEVGYLTFWKAWWAEHQQEFADITMN